MSKPIIKAIELHIGGIGLSIYSKSTILICEGTANVRSIHNATKKDVEWVKAMGGYVPDGRIAKEAE